MWYRQGKKCVTVTGVPLIACPVSIACPMYCSPCPHTVLHRRDHLICRKKGIVKGKAAKWRFLECVRSTARVVAQKFPRVLHFCAWREICFGQKKTVSRFPETELYVYTRLKNRALVKKISPSFSPVTNEMVGEEAGKFCSPPSLSRERTPEKKLFGQPPFPPPCLGSSPTSFLGCDGC